MNLILCYLDKVVKVTISDLVDIHDMIYAYFNLPKSKQLIKYNNQIIHTSNDFNCYDIINGSIINILKKESIDELYNFNGTLNMLHLKIIINGYNYKALIDSGSQISAISEELIDKFNISNSFVRTMSEKVIGVGSSEIIGKVNCDLTINDFSINHLFKVIKSHVDILIIGLDFLYKYDCQIDFRTRSMTIYGKDYKFLSELESGELNNPYHEIKYRFRSIFDKMIDNLRKDEKNKIINLIKLIITNILKNPEDDKFKKINKTSKVFKNAVGSNNFCLEFMKQIGFIENENRLEFRDDNLNNLKYAQEIMLY